MSQRLETLIVLVLALIIASTTTIILWDRILLLF